MLNKLARYVRAHHVGLLALVIAMSGTAYAATALPRNSVGTKQLKRSAVTSSKVKNRSLKAVDFKRGQLPRGGGGRTGPRGPRGLRGLRGLRGRTGAAGVVGNLFVARKDVPLADASQAADAVTCPAGQKVIGGSVNIEASNSADVNITVSRPASGAGQLLPSSGAAFDRWRGVAVNPAGGTGATTMRVWAICTPGTQQAAGTGAGGD